MAVGIAEEDLPGAVGTHFARTKIGFHAGEVFLPFVEIVHAQGEMIAAIARIHAFRQFADDVQLLRAAQSEPSARKREGRSRDWFESQNGAVKSATRLNIADVNGDVVQFVNFHKVLLRLSARISSE